MYSRISFDLSLVIHECIQCVMLKGKFKPVHVFHNFAQVTGMFPFGFKLATPC